MAQPSRVVVQSYFKQYDKGSFSLSDGDNIPLTLHFRSQQLY